MKQYIKYLFAGTVTALCLSACSQTAMTAVALIVGENLGKRTAQGNNYFSQGYAKRNWDTDFRKLKDLKDPQLIEMAKYPEKSWQFLPDEQKFREFTANDFARYRLAFRLPKDTATQPTRYADLYIFATLDMKAEHLAMIGQDAARHNAIVILKGLKNNSLTESMAAAKILTDKGATVVLSPAVYEKINKSHSPTRSYVTVQADGSYGCAPHDGKGCKDHRGFIGIVKPYKPTILTENDLNTAFSKEKESKLGAVAYMYHKLYRELPPNEWKLFQQHQQQ